LQIGMAITNPSQIAASSDLTGQSPDNNGNLDALIALQNQNLQPLGQTPAGAYSALVTQVGSDTSSASNEVNASSSGLQQLNDQQSAESGVDINEEAANMLLYQQGYDAAARVITTIDQLNSIALNMGANGGGY